MNLGFVASPVVRTIRIPGVALAAVLGALVPHTAGATVPPKTGNVVATDNRGRVLDENPALQPGDHVVVMVSGFDPRERVEVWADRLSVLEFAGSDGIVRIPLTITGNSALGQHFVAVVERTPSVSVSSNSGNGSVAAVVPRIGVMPYRVVARSTTEAPEADGGTSRPVGPRTATDVSAPSSGRSLARTGVDVASALFEALFAASVGAVAVVRARGRRSSRTAQS